MDSGFIEFYPKILIRAEVITMNITSSATDPNYAVATSMPASNSISEVTDATKRMVIGTEARDVVFANDKSNDLKLSKENLDNITKTLNDLMQSFNAKIHFQIHDKTKELMVQVVDESTNTVIKEFPPHQLLDTIAAIRDRIGVLLDKRV